MASLTGPADPPLERGRIETLRRAIESEIEKVEEALPATASSLDPFAFDSCAVGRDARMDELESHARARRQRDRDVRRLARLREALERIEAGSYGRCARCGSGISFDRLLAFPEATRCVRCAGG